MADNEALGVLLSKIVVDLADMKKNLSEGRREMQSFKTMASDVGASVKKALTFVGVAVGIYEIATAIKAFAIDAASVGMKVETMGVVMNQVGKNTGMSAESLKYFTEQVKSAGVTGMEAMSALTKAMTLGLNLNQMKEFTTRVRDIAVGARDAQGNLLNTSQTLMRVMHGIESGQIEIFRTMGIAIRTTEEVYKEYAASIGKVKEPLNAAEKAQAMLNEVMRASAPLAGAAATADATVGKQLASMARFAEEAKVALWALFGPVMMAAVQEMTQAWKDLKTWADANQAALAAWGKAVGSWITSIAAATREIVNFIKEHQTLIKTVLELAVFSKLAGIVLGFGRSLASVIPKILEATVAVTGLKLACSGPWSIAITVAIGGVLYGINKIREMHNELNRLQTQAKDSQRGPLTRPGDTFKVKDVPGISARGVMSPELAKSLQEENDRVTKSRKEADDLQKKAQSAVTGGVGKGGGGKGGAGAKETTDNLLAPMLAMYKAKREADLADAENSLNLLKTTNDKKRAILEKDLAEGLIDGQTYYQRLQELQQQETDSAVAMIGKKREAQQKAYKDSLTEIEADTKLSPEAKNIARQKMEADNRKALDKLDTEATQSRLEGETKITEELRRQVELKKQYQDATASLNIDTAQLLGAITEQEATLMRLNLEWKKNREDALKAGLSPSDPYFGAGAANLEARKANTLYGGYASQITQGISSLVDTLMSGGRDLKAAANSMFKSLFNEALKPGLKQLEQLLVNGFKELFGAAGAGIASAVMGAIGLIGMLLTSGGSSSYTPSGIQSGVTSSQAIRGVIAGETSVPIAEISVSLAEAVGPHLKELREINANTRGGAGHGGGLSVTGLGLVGTVRAAIREEMERYFDVVMIKGTP